MNAPSDEAVRRVAHVLARLCRAELERREAETRDKKKAAA